MSLKVLIIDDDPHWREMLSRYLQAAGYEISLASSGFEGLHMITRYRPDLVICDIGMPNGNGYQVVEDLRRDEALRTIPILACTGIGLLDTDAIARETGFDGVLVKSADPELIVATIKVFVSERQ